MLFVLLFSRPIMEGIANGVGRPAITNPAVSINENQFLIAISIINNDQ